MISLCAGGKYYHNIKSAVPTPGTEVMNGAIGHVDLDKVWPYTFPQQLREKKGYATGAQQFQSTSDLLCAILKLGNLCLLHQLHTRCFSESAAVVCCVCALSAVWKVHE